MVDFGIGSYGLAALAYAALGGIVLFSHPGSRRASTLAAALILSVVWAGGIAALLWLDGIASPPLVVLEAVHLFAWTVCVLAWLESRPAKRWLVASAGVAGVWAIVAALFGSPGTTLEQSVYPALLLAALSGFLSVEQVYRNANEQQRTAIKLLCLAAAGIFVADVCVFSQAALLGGPVAGIWEGRGLVNAALAPLILLAVKRQPEWTSELFVSRQVVFYTASLLGVGGYLLAISLFAYVIRAVGGEWSLLLELMFLVAAGGVLIAVLFSAGIRARFRVFLVKHFYRNKYDYRQEWLRLTQSLGRTADPRTLAASALEGLAGIVGSRQGDLFLAREPNRYEWTVSLERRLVAEEGYDLGHPIPAFLASSGWVIDSEEYARMPDRYGTAFGDPADGVLPKGSLIVPLDLQGQLQGFAVLSKPIELQSLNFEDHDILRTAGRQVAVVLAQALAQEKLTETRQFEAMNRLTTFLMHDLKNIVAQQELVVANAQRFRDRREFFDDAITTIRAGVERMKKVLEQLKGDVRVETGASKVDASKLLMEVRSRCADREPVPEIELDGAAVWVNMDRDKLANVLMHLVRNAQDATPPNGHISIGLTTAPGELLVTVSDTGCGMDEVFVRDRLFRPFDSTKGAKGMGIGAYQVRHFVRAAGGDVGVTSKPGVGTTFLLRLPTVNGGRES